MACYYCNRCDRLQDGDWVESVEDPKEENQMCCLECLDEDEQEENEAHELKLWRERMAKRAQK